MAWHSLDRWFIIQIFICYFELSLNYCFSNFRVERCILEKVPHVSPVAVSGTGAAGRNYILTRKA